MSTNGSHGVVGSDSPIDQEELKDLQLIRYLVEKYPQRELMDKFRSVAMSQRSSIISSSTLSSGSIATSPSWERSTVSSLYSVDDPFSIGSGQRSQGSLWPVTDGRYPNHLPTSPITLGEASLHNLTLTTPAVSGHLNGDPVSSSHLVPAPGKACACPFCAERGIHEGATRISDLKRHMRNFHNIDAEWVCCILGCELVFDWPAAYKTHLKQAHGGTDLAANEVKLQLRTQVVFACGFVKCREIFEAPTDGDATQAAKAYFDHVAKHIAHDASIRDWTYSTRIRNLLRQPRVKELWKEYTNKEIRSQLTWQPHNSSVLRKKLECRDIDDIWTLFHVAITLGSLPYSRPDSPQYALPPGFAKPTLDSMVTAWQAQDRAISIGSAQYPSNSSMDSLSIASRLPSSITSILPHDGLSYASTGQESYPLMHSLNPPQYPAQQPVQQHVGVPASQPLEYGSYNLPHHGNMVPQPQHPLEQWLGVESLGPLPSQEEVIADIQNRPKTPGKRFLRRAKKSFESLRGRKNSVSHADSEMAGSTPPMPTTFPAPYNVTGSQSGYGSSSSQLSLSHLNFQFPHGQDRY